MAKKKEKSDLLNALLEAKFIIKDIVYPIFSVVLAIVNRVEK